LQDQSEKARNYVFLLLKFRLRSEKEVIARLKIKKFDPAIIKETVEFLKDKDFLNDKHFASAWVNSRLKKPLGLRRIRQELRLKGVDKEIIDAKIEEVKKNYSEKVTVERIARERIKRLEGLEPEKRKTRLFAYLMRRGFSTEDAMDAINQL